MKTLAAVLAFATLLTQCSGPRDARYKPHELTVTGSSLPPNILTAGIHGVLPVNAGTSDTDLCCWMAPQASFQVEKPRRAHELTLGIYIPDVSPYRTRGQEIAVSLPQYRQRKIFGNLRSGFHELHVTLTPIAARATGALTIMANSRVVYAPLGATGPRYGALLISAYFQ